MPVVDEDGWLTWHGPERAHMSTRLEFELGEVFRVSDNAEAATTGEYMESGVMARHEPHGLVLAWTETGREIGAGDDVWANVSDDCGGRRGVMHDSQVATLGMLPYPGEYVLAYCEWPGDGDMPDDGWPLEGWVVLYREAAA